MIIIFSSNLGTWWSVLLSVIIYLLFKTFERHRPIRQLNQERKEKHTNLPEIINILHTIPLIIFYKKKYYEELSNYALRLEAKRQKIDISKCIEKKEIISKFKPFSDSEDLLCSICLENYENGDVLRQLLKCKHYFHVECLDRWAYSQKDKNVLPMCPLCKQKI